MLIGKIERQTFVEVGPKPRINYEGFDRIFARLVECYNELTELEQQEEVFRAVQRNAPPQKPGEEVKLLYASQVGTRPPAFVIMCNRPADVPEAYQRYLLNGFRAAWGFDGAPVRLKFKRRTRGRRT